MSPVRSRVRMGKRGTVSLPLDLLEGAGLDLGGHVWIISDGDILIIRSVFRKPRSPYPSLIRQLSGAFRRFLSR